MRPNAEQLSRLKAIPGLGAHVLAGPGGEVLDAGTDGAEELAALVSVACTAAKGLQAELGSAPFNYLAFQRGQKERLVIIPVNGAGLAFFQKRSSLGTDVIGAVLEWRESLILA